MEEQLPIILALCAWMPPSVRPASIHLTVDSKDSGGCETSDAVCDNGQCILKSWKCDGSQDCEDGSDEVYCTLPAFCPFPEHHCAPEGRCLPDSWRCDGIRDCKDGSDEENCQLAGLCPESFFRCFVSLNCISKQAVCDGKLDCLEGEDEDPELCPVRPLVCPKNQIACLDKSGCVEALRWCDKRPDCPDRSDENNDMCHSDFVADKSGCLLGGTCNVVLATVVVLSSTTWLCSTNHL